MITENGRKLFHEIARKQEYNLIPPFGRNSEDINDIIDICSRLKRAAKTYERIQEKWCNDEMSELATKRLENDVGASKQYPQDKPRLLRADQRCAGVRSASTASL